LYSPFRHSYRSGLTTRPDSFDLHVSTTPPAFALSQDQTLHLERFVARHDSVHLSESASHGIQHTMSPGCSGCCRPGQPVFPYARHPRATCGRDTLPLCLGSNSSLDKERPGLAASVRQGLYEDREACQRPAWFFSLFRTPAAWTATGARGCYAAPTQSNP
jgi:hypothetical protein